MSFLIENKKARFDYKILESFQAGLSLSGQMVKAIRLKTVKLEGVFIVHQKGQLQMVGLKSGEMIENVSLLLSAKEKEDMIEGLKIKGNTGVVLGIKRVGRWLKADVAVVKGKAEHDKRDTIKKRDLDRDERRGIL